MTRHERGHETQVAMVALREYARAAREDGADYMARNAEVADDLVVDLRSGEMVLAHCADERCSQDYEHAEHDGGGWVGWADSTEHHETRTHRLEVGPLLWLLLLAVCATVVAVFAPEVLA